MVAALIVAVIAIAAMVAVVAAVRRRLEDARKNEISDCIGG